MDRDKVIYDIERCICHVPDACRDCSHYGHGEVIGCMEELLTDALALLKKHEDVKPQLSISGMWYECPICHRHLTKDRDNYCARCGRSLNWK